MGRNCSSTFYFWRQTNCVQWHGKPNRITCTTIARN